MTITQILAQKEKFEIQAYGKPQGIQELRKHHIPFSGSPRKHPYDNNHVILVADPYSSASFYYEFRASDIACVEELPHIVNPDGEAVHMVRVWVKKRSVGLRCTPFLVEDISRTNR
ncbi:MAG: inorganic pyrophosphatase Ppa [Thermodesulfobacteriota bacterium]